MKYLLILLTVALISCNKKNDHEEPFDEIYVQNSIPAAVPSQLLITPGRSIGNISINQNASELEAILGPPDLSDAAMGKAWLTWFSKISDSITGNELNIYTTYRPNDPDLIEKIVRQIRITSSDFKTSDGISTASTLADIKAVFPNITETGKFDHETDSPVVVYDDVASGVAFEIESDHCTGIIIHEKGISVGKEYITFHPDMKPM